MLAQDDLSSALDIIACLITSAPGMSPGRVITYLWKLKAEALAAKGDTEQARNLLREAIENGQAFDERFLLWRLHASLARLYRTMGKKEDAEKEYLRARSLIDELAAPIADEMLQNRFLQGACGVLETSPINLSER